MSLLSMLYKNRASMEAGREPPHVFPGSLEPVTVESARDRHPVFREFALDHGITDLEVAATLACWAHDTGVPDGWDRFWTLVEMAEDVRLHVDQGADHSLPVRRLVESLS